MGSNVTLRSLLPSVTSTVRVSAFQPDFGMATTTLCQPTATFMLIGVTLRVSAPSTHTLAPVGNEVTFNEPCPPCATALPGATKSTTANPIVQIILLIQRTLLGWFIESSLNALLLDSFAQTSRAWRLISREFLRKVAAIAAPPPLPSLNHLFSTNWKEIATPRTGRRCNERLPFRHKSLKPRNILSS
jgi:hypothetical protein